MKMWVVFSLKPHFQNRAVKNNVSTSEKLCRILVQFHCWNLLLFFPLPVYFPFVTSNLSNIFPSPVSLQLSETKIFTASSVASLPLPQENVTITKGQRWVVNAFYCYDSVSNHLFFWFFFPGRDWEEENNASVKLFTFLTFYIYLTFTVTLMFTLIYICIEVYAVSCLDYTSPFLLQCLLFWYC